MPPAPMISLTDCWAKTDRATGLPTVSLLDHSMIVGAVARELMKHLPHEKQMLLNNGLLVVIAAHDIGKATPGFLSKSGIWKTRWMPAGPEMGDDTDHARVGEVFLRNILKPLGSRRWAAAIGGHHGRYQASTAPITEKLPDTFHEIRTDLLDELIAEFGPPPENSKPSDEELHWFTGFIILCDWIGSDEWFFPPSTLPEKYQQRAKEAISSIGLISPHVLPELSFPELFRVPGEADFIPNSLQAALIGAASSPGIHIVEADMGIGKTEAALAAAYRLWEEGHDTGLYFALPTRLTSERVHRRLRRFLENLCTGDARLTLVHGSAWLDIKRVLRIQPAAPGTEGEETEADAFSWFASSKRALIAPYGAGTIDQALLGGMSVKHAALRFHALGGKTVIFDEVHSYDAYTFGLLCRLIGNLTHLGGSVFILSATLTHARRRQLVEAAGGREVHPGEAYPLITSLKYGEEMAKHIPVPNDNPAKAVTLETTGETVDFWENAVSIAEGGACVLVIRNTVASAQETAKKLTSMRHGEDTTVALLHSRFTQRDRKELEDLWMERLGKNPVSRPSKGCILVSTQVCEQSVDIDADYLITDLAPSDLILQRIGRLHRHKRNRPKNSLTPRASVIVPEVDLMSDTKTVKQQLGDSAYVYPPYVLLRSLETISKFPKLNLPADFRPVLEATHLERTEPCQPLMELKQELDREGKLQGDAAQGRTRLLNTIATDDPDGRKTRWSKQDSASLVLLSGYDPRQNIITFPDGTSITFNPYEFSRDLAVILHLNAVLLPLHAVKAWTANTPEWLQNHVPGAVAFGKLDEFQRVTPFDPSIIASHHFTYSDLTGLTMEKKETADLPYEEDGCF